MTPEHRARILCEEFALGKWEPGVTLEMKVVEAIKAPGDTDLPIVHKACFVCGQSLVSDGHIRDCVAKLQLERRGFQIMARRMLHPDDAGYWTNLVLAGHFDRAGGDVQCPVCRHFYYEHPQIPAMPTFHLTCTRRIVKL